MQLLHAKLTDAIIYGGKSEYLSRVSRYASRGVVTDRNNRVAMMRMSSKGSYKLPGGGVESGESKEQAFIREVEEETGYRCEIVQELGHIEEHKNKNSFLQYSHCFLGRIVGEQQNTRLTANEQRQGFELIWMESHEAIAVLDRLLRSGISYGDGFMLTRDKMILQYASGQMARWKH